MIVCEGVFYISSVLFITGMLWLFWLDDRVGTGDVLMAVRFQGSWALLALPYPSTLTLHVILRALRSKEGGAYVWALQCLSTWWQGYHWPLFPHKGETPSFFKTAIWKQTERGRGAVQAAESPGFCREVLPLPELYTITHYLLSCEAKKSTFPLFKYFCIMVWDSVRGCIQVCHLNGEDWKNTWLVNGLAVNQFMVFSSSHWRIAIEYVSSRFYICHSCLFFK